DLVGNLEVLPGRSGEGPSCDPRAIPGSPPRIRAERIGLRRSKRPIRWGRLLLVLGGSAADSWLSATAWRSRVGGSGFWRTLDRTHRARLRRAAGWGNVSGQPAERRHLSSFVGWGSFIGSLGARDHQLERVQREFSDRAGPLQPVHLPRSGGPAGRESSG